MTKEVIVHISYDDLSEQVKKDIEKLRKNGTAVKIYWPENDHIDKIGSLPYITPSIQPPLELDDDNIWKETSKFYCGHGEFHPSPSAATATLKTFNGNEQHL